MDISGELKHEEQTGPFVDQRSKVQQYSRQGNRKMFLKPKQEDDMSKAANQRIKEENRTTQKTSEAETNLEILDETKATPLSIHCWVCTALIGPWDSLFTEFVSKKTELHNIFCKSNIYTCLVCQTIEIQFSTVFTHILKHCKNAEVFCQRCVVELKIEDCFYKLEVMDSSEIKINNECQEESTTSGLPKESPHIPAEEYNQVIPCGQCGNLLGQVSNVIPRLIQTSKGVCVLKKASTDQLCLICGQHSTQDDWFKMHILKHLHLREIYCRTCYHQESKLAHTTQNEKLFSKFIPNDIETIESYIVRCGKCEIYLADYSTLVMSKLVECPNEGIGNSYSQKELTYECLLCSAERRSILMVKHVRGHIASNDIICYKCDETENREYSYVCSIRRIILRPDKILALGSPDYDVCQKCHQEFNNVNVIVEQLDIFVLKERTRKGDIKERIIFRCLLCPKSCKCSEAIRKHILTHNPSEGTFCWDCNNEEKIQNLMA